MKIYIAGPYTQGNKEDNVQIALDAAEIIVAKGHVPFIPRLTHYWDLAHTHGYEFWLKYDIEWLSVCSGLCRLPGFSPGADREVGYALSHGIIVYNGLDEVPDFATLYNEHLEKKGVYTPPGKPVQWVYTGPPLEVRYDK